MHHVLAVGLTLTVLAGFAAPATAQTFDADARIAITLDQKQMRFADSGGTQTAIIADLSNRDPERLRLQTTDYRLSIAAFFPLSQPLVSTQALSYLRLAREVLADPGDGATAYGLGPAGGTVTITETEPLGVYDQFRVRGTFSAEVCPESAAEANLPCRQMTGSFAFNLSGPQEGRQIDGL